MLQLVNTIENSEKTTEMIKWISDISKPESGVVDSLIQVFMDSLEKTKLANSILRTIRKMNQYAEKQVLP